MKARAITSSIFAWLFGAPILGVIICAVLEEFGWFPNSHSTMRFLLSVALITLIFIFGVYYSYSNKKKKSTCPRCKEPFCWYEKCIGTETLSENYISEDVEKSDNGRRYYVRQGFRVGKERDYYRSTCKECGYTTERTEVSSYKRKV